MSDNLWDRPKRFEIFVPSPKARINLGSANLTEKDEGPFGYSGISIQSGDAHLFIDSNKHTLFQSGVNYCGQVGGSWVQFSNSNMTMSATASVNVSADKKIVIASGAGQGQITAKDHGQNIKLVGYNNLELHYQVDKIQTSLFEFFHGRRKHDDRSALAKLGGVKDAYFDGGGKAGTELAKAGFKGGFIVNSALSLRELAPPGNKRDIDKIGKWGKGDTRDPVFHLDALLLKTIAKSSDDPSVLKYGFSSYLSQLDPYAMIDTSKITNPLAKGFAKLRNALAKLRRFADVALKYANLITDNFIVKRATAAMDAIGGLAGASKSAYNLGAENLGYWMKDDTADPGAGGRDTPFGGAFVDEFKSGLGARAPSGDLGKVGDDARESLTGDQAKVTAKAGPYNLSANTAVNWVLEIHTEHPASDRVFTLEQLAAAAQSGTPAILPVTANKDAVVPAFRLTLSSATQTVPTASVAVWVGTELGVPVANNTVAQIVRPSGNTVRGHLRTPATLNDKTKVFTVSNVDITLKFGDIVTLTRIDQQRPLTLSVDGANTVVTLDSASLDQSTDAKIEEGVQAIFTAAVGSAGTVTALASSAFSVETNGNGLSKTITVIDGDAGALSALGLSVGQSVAGTDPSATGTVDLTSVTADQIVALLGSVEGLEAAAVNGAVELKSAAKALESKDSVVTVSGSLATEIFTGLKTKTETVSGYKAYAARSRGTQAQYKQLLAWNFELQKMPEDARNLTRPITEAIGNVVGALSKLEKALESAVDIASSKFKKGLPGSKETIGLIANEGIVLGTQDRIVGTGGQGIVFIADGGIGSEDHDKFIPKIENFVNVALSFDPIDQLIGRSGTKASPDEDKPPSLGFRVYSDSVVDMFGTYATQMMALGRGKVTAKMPDKEDEIGVGIARVAGSHAVDIAGYRRVVVGARNAGTKGKFDTGGQLDLLGQTIFLGGFNSKGGKLKDFVDKGGLGIEPLAIASLAGHEQLSTKELGNLKDDIEAFGWTKELRENHPNTNFVRIHSAKETTMVVGGFMLHMNEADGFTLGTRQDNAKPGENEVDDTKAHILLNATKVTLLSKDKSSNLLISDKEARLQQGSKTGPRVMLKKDAARVDFSKTVFLQMTASKSLLKQKGSSLELKPSGVKLVAKEIKINGKKVSFG